MNLGIPYQRLYLCNLEICNLGIGVLNPKTLCTLFPWLGIQTHEYIGTEVIPNAMYWFVGGTLIGLGFSGFSV